MNGVIAEKLFDIWWNLFPFIMISLCLLAVVLIWLLPVIVLFHDGISIIARIFILIIFFLIFHVSLKFTIASMVPNRSE